MSNGVCTYKSKLRNKEDFKTLIFSLPEVNNYCVNVIKPKLELFEVDDIGDDGDDDLWHHYLPNFKQL